MQAQALDIAPLPNAIVIVEEAAHVVGRIAMLRLYAREQRLGCRSNRTGAATRARNGRRPARQVRPWETASDSAICSGVRALGPFCEKLFL